MPPTAHAQLAVRVFLQTETNISVSEINTTFRNMEEGYNKITEVQMGNLDLSWYAEESGNGAYIEGFDAVFTDNNTVPLVLIGGLLASINDVVENDDPVLESYDIDIESPDDDEINEMRETVEGALERDALESISTEEDVIYSCSARGDIANISRPGFNEYVGIGGFGSQAIEKIRKRADSTIDAVDYPLHLDTVESNLYDIPAVFLNVKSDEMPGWKADEIMDFMGNPSGLSLVGKISRTE